MKNFLYSDASVREYWIVDPEKNFTTVYYLEQDSAPTIIPLPMRSIQIYSLGWLSASRIY